MGQFFSRILTAYMKAKSELGHVKLAHRLPHPDLLIDLVLVKARRVYTTKYYELLNNPLNPLSENNLTIEIVQQLYYEAARLSDRSFDKAKEGLRSTRKPPPTEKAPKAPKAPKPSPKPEPPPAPSLEPKVKQYSEHLPAPHSRAEKRLQRDHQRLESC